METLYYQNSKDEHIKFEYAKILEKKGYIEDAKELFKELLSTQNADYASLELGKIFAHDKKYSEAKKYFLRLARKGDRYGILELGMLEKEKGNFDEARKLFMSLFDEPNKVKAKFQVAKIEAMVGNINVARFYFQDLIGTYHDNYARLELGRLETKVENFDEARKIFKELNTSSSLLELGILEYRAGNIDKSRNCFESLLNAENAAYAYRLLLILELKNGNDKRVLNLMKQMVKRKIKLNSSIVLYLSKKYNIFFENYDYNSINYSYCHNQLLNYNLDDAINHIRVNHFHHNEKLPFLMILILKNYLILSWKI